MPDHDALDREEMIPQYPEAPRVTVIVPAWGVAEHLGEALASLQGQTMEHWQAIVVDDGDAAAVAGAVAPFSDDPRIRLLVTDNAGASTARNRGIATAQTPFVSMLDGDDRYRPDYLERMLAAAEAAPEIGFVTCDARMFGIPEFEGRIFSESHPQQGEIMLERVIRREVYVFGSCLVRREALAQVGGYDPQLRAAEDLDLWIRILAAGWQAALVPLPLVEYRRRAGSLSADTLLLARADRQMYTKTVAALAGRPEQEAARAMLARCDNALNIEEGLEAIAAGRTREGLAMIRDSDLPRRSRKWRLAMAAFRVVPALAGPALRLYIRRHPFG